MHAQHLHGEVELVVIIDACKCFIVGIQHLALDNMPKFRQMYLNPIAVDLQGAQIEGSQ